MVALVGNAVTHPLRHSRHQVLQHTRLDVASRPLQLLHLIGGGDRCHLPDLACKIAQRFSIGLWSRLLPGHSALPQRPGRFSWRHCCVFWVVYRGAPSCLKTAWLVSASYQRALKNPASRVMTGEVGHRGSTGLDMG